MPYSYLVDNRGNSLLKTFSNFMKSFDDIKAIEKSISLVISKVPMELKSFHIQNSIEEILKDNQRAASIKNIELLDKLKDSSLHLFYKPDKEGLVEVPDLLGEIDSSSNYVMSRPNMASITLSEEAQIFSANLLNSASNNFNQIVEVIVKAILDTINCLSTNQHNELIQNHTMIQKWIPKSIQYKELASHQEGEHFLGLDLLSKLQKILNPSQLDNISDGLNILKEVIEVIAEYVRSNNLELKHQIQGYGYCLQQQFEYVKFFADVNSKDLPGVGDLTELLKLCHVKVTENLEFQISTLSIDLKQTDQAYFHKAISYLEKYLNSEPCVKLKALCYSGLAGIAEHENDTPRAINWYIKAIEADKEIAEIYEKLGKLFFSTAKYSKAIEAYKVVNNEFDINLCFKKWLELEPRNPDVMLKKAQYLESISLYDKAKTYYHNVFSLSKDEVVKASAWEKIGNINLNAAACGQQFIERAQNHDFFNFNLVDASFIQNLMGDTSTQSDS